MIEPVLNRRKIHSASSHLNDSWFDSFDQKAKADDALSQVNEKLEINMKYCFWFTVAYGIGTFQTAWAASGNANTHVIFRDKLGWDEDEAVLYNTIVSTAGVLGLFIGSFLGGLILKLGRRPTVIIAQALGIASALPSMIVNVPMLTIARLLCGTSAGIYNVVFGKLITETLPPQIMSQFCMAHNGLICVGFFVVFLMGAFLPDAEDLQANKDDEMWRIIWLGSAAIGVYQIIITLFVLKQEPVAYCVMTGDDDEGRKLMARVYRKKDPDSPEKFEDIIAEEYNRLKANTTLDAASTTFKDSVCGRKYRAGTWFCFIFNTFNQQTGINAVNVYANSLLV